MAQTLLVDQVQALANGTLSTEEFQAATATSNITQHIQEATLPGTLLAQADTPTPDDGGDSNALAIGLGVGLGVGIPALVAAAWATRVLLRRRTVGRVSVDEAQPSP